MSLIRQHINPTVLRPNLSAHRPPTHVRVFIPYASFCFCFQLAKFLFLLSARIWLAIHFFISPTINFWKLAYLCFLKSPPTHLPTKVHMGCVVSFWQAVVSRVDFAPRLTVLAHESATRDVFCRPSSHRFFFLLFLIHAVLLTAEIRELTDIGWWRCVLKIWEGARQGKLRDPIESVVCRYWDIVEARHVCS